MQSLLSKNPGRFEFPITFSPSLLQVAILGSLIRIILETTATENTGPLNATYSIQTISYPIDHDISGEELVTKTGLGNVSAMEKEIYANWRDRSFSADGFFLLTSEVQGRIYSMTGTSFVDFGKWLLTVWGRSGDNDYKIISRVKIPADIFRAQGPYFAFHPELPILVLSELCQTSVWYFAEPGARTFRIVRELKG